MPNPHQPIWKRGRRNRPPKEAITTKLKQLIMNGKLDKLKSRKLWVAVIGAAIIAFGTGMGMSEDTITKLVALLSAYVIGQGVADHGKAAIIALCGALLMFSAPAQAGEESPLQLPDLPEEIENQNWLENGSIWSFAWGDLSNETSGVGVRFGYEITENVRIRFDYLVEAFDFDEGAFADQSEATLSMRYDFGASNSIYPYLIAGGGSASLSSFQWEYLIGGGLDYEFKNGITAFVEFLHIRTESSAFDDRNEIRVGAGIPLDRVVGMIPLPFGK